MPLVRFRDVMNQLGYVDGTRVSSPMNKEAHLLRSRQSGYCVTQVEPTFVVCSSTPLATRFDRVWVAYGCCVASNPLAISNLSTSLLETSRTVVRLHMSGATSFLW